MPKGRISQRSQTKKSSGTAKFIPAIGLCRGASPERAGKCADDEQDKEDEKKHLRDRRRQTGERKKSQKASHQGKKQKRQGPTEHRGFSPVVAQQRKRSLTGAVPVALNKSYALLSDGEKARPKVRPPRERQVRLSEADCARTRASISRCPSSIVRCDGLLTTDQTSNSPVPMAVATTNESGACLSNLQDLWHDQAPPEHLQSLPGWRC